jgi:pimeloyl-[acyl-carrier protein] methyl ester esterase
MPAKPLIQVVGKGPDLVMLHGWGSHKGIWGTFAEQLSRRYRLHLVDLPGHGDSSRTDCRFSANGFARAVADNTPPAAWMGSSLGGLIVINAALDFPEKVRQMVLISTNPSFVIAPDWEYAQDPNVFDGFSKLLDTGVEKTLQYFSKLEVAGSANARTTLASLKSVQSKLPEAEALRCGLQILRTENLVDRLGRIKAPSLVIGGSQDRLVPIEAIRETARRIPGAILHTVDEAGHAPFVSHGDSLLEPVTEFLQRKKAA